MFSAQTSAWYCHQNHTKLQHKADPTDLSIINELYLHLTCIYRKLDPCHSLNQYPSGTHGISWIRKVLRGSKFMKIFMPCPPARHIVDTSVEPQEFKAREAITLLVSKIATVRALGVVNDSETDCQTDLVVDTNIGIPNSDGQLLSRMQSSTLELSCDERTSTRVRKTLSHIIYFACAGLLRNIARLLVNLCDTKPRVPVSVCRYHARPSIIKSQGWCFEQSKLKLL
ncbi:hypothetical protein J6590_050857 [Homalodisca vitripennis]|nr:hypothetical protein J6590_050857 [Homalodisca vitripennis]